MRQRAQNPVHNARLHDDLWSTEKIARNERDRDGWREVCLKRYIEPYYIGGEANLGWMHYRLEGPGHKTTYLWAADPEQALQVLQDRLGPLAEFEVLIHPSQIIELSPRQQAAARRIGIVCRFGVAVYLPSEEAGE